MDKQESLDFLDSCIEDIKNLSPEETEQLKLTLDKEEEKESNPIFSILEIVEIR